MGGSEMTNNRVKCSQCGKALQTVHKNAPVKKSPLVCWYCFGIKSYHGRRSQWHQFDGGVTTITISGEG